MKQLEPSNPDAERAIYRDTQLKGPRNKPEAMCECCNAMVTRGRTDDGRPICAGCKLDAEKVRRERIKRL